MAKIFLSRPDAILAKQLFAHLILIKSLKQAMTTMASKMRFASCPHEHHTIIVSNSSM